MILARYAQDSPLRIVMSGDPSTRTITAEITNTSAASVSGNLYFVLTESDAVSPPGSTYGTQHQEHAMLDLIPDANGEAILLGPGASIVKQRVYNPIVPSPTPPYWAEAKMECIVFVQNVGTKEVIQAGKIYFPLDQPELLLVDYTFDDTVTGDGDGYVDPGETGDLILTLTNLNPADATTVTGVLTTSDPDATVNDGSGAWPDIVYGASGTNAADPFSVTIDAGASFGQEIAFHVVVTSNAGAATKEFDFSLGVGAPTDPIGADGYGYFAYEEVDGAGNVPLPTYNWVEIDPNLGGPGTLVTLGDDQTVYRPLPFSFRFYGNIDTQVSICSNGIISLGQNPGTWVSNAPIPDPNGPPKMIAGFWTDLNPVAAGGGKVYEWSDPVGGRYIVEFSGVEHYEGSGNGQPETFQFILYNPLMHPTQTGDGQVDIQYALVNDPSGCTVGIENQTETIGIQYLASGALNAAAHGLQAGRVIRFTTTPPGGIVGVEGPSVAPGGLWLAARPNPFRGGTAISYAVPETGEATLQIFAADGSLVRTLIEGKLEAGSGVVSWDGRDARGAELPAGVYLYRLTGKEYETSGKVIRVR